MDDLDLPRGDPLVFRAFEPLGHPAGDLDHILIPQRVRQRGDFRILLGMEYALRQSFAVPQVDEDHAAMVAGGVHPTDEGDSQVDVGVAEFVAMVGAHVCKKIFNRR